MSPTKSYPSLQVYVATESIETTPFAGLDNPPQSRATKEQNLKFSFLIKFNYLKLKLNFRCETVEEI